MSREDFWKGKVIIITGAGSGIGLASARLFAGLGAKVVMAARSYDVLLQEAAKMPNPDDILCVKTDVSVEDDCRNLIDRTVERFGKIDVLVNNAGISMRAMFNDLDLQVIHRLMDTNFYGTVNCTKLALPYLLQSQGSVVGVISIAGFNPLPARTGYSSSKYAIRGFLDTLRVEHLYDNLHVMVFSPGFTASNIRNTALTVDGSQQGETPRDEGKMMTAERVAEYLEKGLRKRKNEMILTPTGKLYVALRKIMPRLADRLCFNYMAKEPNSPFGKKH